MYHCRQFIDVTFAGRPSSSWLVCGCVPVSRPVSIGRGAWGASGWGRRQLPGATRETAAASALTGVITDPRALAAQLGLGYQTLALPERASVNTAMLEAPLPQALGFGDLSERRLARGT